MRALRRHHKERVAIKIAKISKNIKGSGFRRGRLSRYQLGCKGKCWLCKPHKFKKFERPKIKIEDYN